MHFVNNAFGLIFLFVTKPPKINFYEQITGIYLLQYLCLAVIAGIILVGALIIIYRTTRTVYTDKLSKKFSVKMLFHWPILISIILLMMLFGYSIKEIVFGI